MSYDDVSERLSESGLSRDSGRRVVVERCPCSGVMSAWWEIVPAAITVIALAAGALALVWAAIQDGRENELAHGVRRRVPRGRRDRALGATRRWRRSS